jgi:hypothetical protein
MGREIIHFFAPSPISCKCKRILPLSLSAECVAFYNIVPAHSLIGFIVYPVLEPQQHHQPRFQIRRLYELLKERIAKKRWEFQHTTFDPQKLWKIANEVEALNWVLQKVEIKSGVEGSLSEDMFDRIILQLQEELLRIRRYLYRPSKVNFESSKRKRDRLKSRASAIEWSLFQLHFLLAEPLTQEEESHLSPLSKSIKTINIILHRRR